MRGWLLNLSGIARAAGFLLVAIAIIAATLHFRDTLSPTQKHSTEAEAASEPLSDELRRCQALAAQAKDDAACEAAWAENRRRFFTYRPEPTAVFVPDARAASPGR